ncbi:MAG: 16S rRNA (cytidine(1402)-2'-O)-methyltransferase [Clostridiales bacterium]|jgi:16S rRNA (cytidine1402-2'-O)-methyltransferase|nr:16S rRNA (cytidine(1402)-2'-O)-methyltransferase [Clostridiales bacterium]
MGEGILYLCGTPIGNLEDISARALKILKSVDLIAAEDTRHSARLLNYFEINVPLTSYYEHNKHSKGPKLIEMLLEGKKIALVSDAGMPSISDPGEGLVNLCYENHIKVVAIPGPTAVITALVLSGLPSRRYVFEGFLPTDKKELGFILNVLKNEARTIIIYESPHHLLKTLKLLYEYLGPREIAVVREMTKVFEETVRGRFLDVIDIFSSREIKGEFVIVVEGKKISSIIEDGEKQWGAVPVMEHMKEYAGLSKKDAIKQVAKDRGVPKREIYDIVNGVKKKAPVN